VRRLAAAITVAKLDVDAPSDRLARNLFLELRFRVLVDDLASARAALGQRRREDLIDIAWRFTTRRRPVGLAGLASPRFRVLLGKPLGEGRRLALLPAERFLQLLLQRSDDLALPAEDDAEREPAQPVAAGSEEGRSEAVPLGCVSAKQERLRILPLTADLERAEVLVPEPVRRIGLRLPPKLQRVEVFG
jgi:hypothetical protein